MTNAYASATALPRFWPRWLPTFIGFIAGGAIGTAIVGRIDSIAAALIGGAIAGAVIGCGQYLALRQFVPRSIWWIPATAAGQAIGLAAAAPIVDYGTQISDLMIMGAITGTFIGFFQAAVLGQGGIRPFSWTFATSICWALGWLATWAIGVDVEKQYVNFGAAGAITYTLLTLPLLTLFIGTLPRKTVPLP